MSTGLKLAISGWSMAALLAMSCLPAAAQQCKPKTAGYFMQMTGASRRATSPIVLAGIVRSLTGSIGDPAHGRSVIADPDKGNCIACHNVPALGDRAGSGDLGPNLNGVGARYTESQIRQIIVDPGVIFPDTVMPAYYKPLQYAGIPDQMTGKTVLSAAEVEDIIAYLKNLR